MQFFPRKSSIRGSPAISRKQRKKKMTLKTLLLLGLVAFTQARVLNEYWDGKIINGVDAMPGEIPYQASVQRKVSKFHFCGAVILNKDFVLTAAHCVASEEANKLQVIVGTLNLDDPKSIHDVEYIKYHEKYDAGNSWINDIAVMKMKVPFVETKYISFVKLPTPDQIVKEFDPAVVSGWGRLWQNGPTPKHLQRAGIVIADQTYCEKIYWPSQNIYPSHVCAYDPTEMRGSCNGDSGGPLTVNGELVGLVSWGRGCADTIYPTVYTRVASFLDWIAEKTA